MTESDKTTFRLIDLVEIAVSDKRRLIRNHIIVAVGAVLLALVLPKWYQASTLVFPPDQAPTEGIEGVLGSPVARQFLSSLSMEGAPTSSMIVIGTLKSRLVAFSVIDSLDLVSHYRSKSAEKAYRTFRRRLVVEGTPEGFIEVRVLDRNPEMAARIANECVSELKRQSVVHNRSRARRTRSFIEARLDSTRLALHASLDSLRGFQESSGLIEVGEQTKAVIELAGALLAERASAEVALTSLRGYATDANPAVREATRTIAAIDDKLRQLSGTSDVAADGGSSLSLRGLPSEAMRYAGLLLAVKTQEESYAILAGQYEKARIEEARETASIDVLDVATPPIKKARPKRSLVVLAILFASVAFHTIYYSARLSLRGSAQVDRWRRVWDDARGARS